VYSETPQPQRTSLKRPFIQLVEFLHHGNTQIRQIGTVPKIIQDVRALLIMGFYVVATENLVPYSETQPQIFKIGQLTPVKDLKVLVKDYAVCRSSIAIAFANDITLTCLPL